MFNNFPAGVRAFKELSFRQNCSWAARRDGCSNGSRRTVTFSEREDARQDLVAYIQSQAKFLGWKELSGEDPEKIQDYLHMANNLDKVLEA